MRILAALLPQSCLLCATTSAEALLCADCAGGLPRLTGPRCPVCAVPTPDGTVCGACLKHPPHFDATLALFRYAFPVDKLIQALKYQHRLAVADYLATTMAAGVHPAGDMVIPLPLSGARLRERGFNQAMELARPLARALALPLAASLCRRHVDTPPQAALPWPARRRNIRGAFECGVDFTGRELIVVDDVMTTGSTLDECARTLKSMGARRVTNWVAARAVRNAP